VQCILVVHGAEGADQPVCPAAETLMSNRDTVWIAWACVFQLVFLLHNTHVPPRSPGTVARTASVRITRLSATISSVRPQSHDRCSGRLAEGAARMSRRLLNQACRHHRSICSVWWPCLRHAKLQARSPSGLTLVVSCARKHMRTLFQQMAAMPGRHCAPTEAVPTHPGHQHARWRSRLHNHASVASYTS
jgi:hypothetical protein